MAAEIRTSNRSAASGDVLRWLRALCVTRAGMGVTCEQMKALHKELPMMSETLMRVAADMANSWNHKCPRYLWPLLEGHNRVLGDANGWLGHAMCMRQQCVPARPLSLPAVCTARCTATRGVPQVLVLRFERQTATSGAPAT